MDIPDETKDYDVTVVVILLASIAVTGLSAWYITSESFKMEAVRVGYAYYDNGKAGEPEWKWKPNPASKAEAK